MSKLFSVDFENVFDKFKNFLQPKMFSDFHNKNDFFSNLFVFGMCDYCGVLLLTLRVSCMFLVNA